MKKFKILIPVYNDWGSVFKLLEKIDIEISIFDHEFSVILVNDSSTQKMIKNNFVFKNLKSVIVVKMKKNQGHTKSNATGIKFLSKKKDFDFLIVMDGDGEDRPEEIKSLVKEALNNEASVVAKRVKRSEGIFFQTLYQIHKIITLFFTGKNMNFGNYCCLTRKDVEMLSTKKSLWGSFPGSVKKYIPKALKVPSIRGSRYEGPSKMSLYKLIILSLSIIAVFKYQVLIRSLIYISILYFLIKLQFTLIVILQTLILLFVISIFLISKEENILSLESSTKDIERITNIYTK